ncbi:MULTISPECIES: glycosyltransferase family 2 protein [Kitasatospora]|uniref:Glycosyltransferase involved in cell wall biosynthesis n=2 Tax=Kitasatospora TaxID=2063 RepID=A0ABT1IXZ8_9ACTN|nr:glycosyltransferase family 2 protein [Kitasatospora paracochleata]MCP2309793.1 glycosyltransferase involved in cell wall biosynthesis [Kitasatospora paracochleata]
MTTLDIMLPYYGDVSLMQTAVRSILAQSDPNWRLTVVDDGKEPDVPGWFEQLGDERVSYQRNEQNLGVTGNYRKCLGLVREEHFVMMGTDDVMLPDYVATVRAALAANPGIGMVQPGVQVIDGDGVPTEGLADQAKKRIYAPKVNGSRVMGGEELATNLLRGNWLFFPSICWRTEAVRSIGFRDNLEVTQDLALVIDLLQAGERMLISDTVCFQYRRHAVSISSKQAFTGARFAEANRFFQDVADRLDEHGWPKAAKASRLHLSSRIHALTMLPGALKNRQSDGAKTLLRHVAGNDVR